MKRILILGDLSSIHTRLWIDSYIQAGFDVYAFSLEEPREDLPPQVKIFYRKPITGYKWKYLLHMKTLKKVLEKANPRIIHAHMVPNYGTMALMSGLPYVISPWGRDILWMKPSRKMLFSSILKRAILIHADAYILKKTIVEKFHIEPQKIMVFPFGISGELREKPLAPLSRDFFHLVEFRRHYDSIYNQTNIIRAMAILREMGIKRFHLWMLSGGADTENYIELVKKLNLEDFVTITGGSSRQEILEKLHTSHIYISGSLVDSTSVSLLEAMASGAVPVVSDILANHEWVSHGFNGMLFSPYHPEDIASALKMAMDFRFIERARRINKEMVNAKANWGKNFSDFVQILRGIMD